MAKTMEAMLTAILQDSARADWPYLSAYLRTENWPDMPPRLGAAVRAVSDALEALYADADCECGRQGSAYCIRVHEAEEDVVSNAILALVKLVFSELNPLDNSGTV